MLTLFKNARIIGATHVWEKGWLLVEGKHIRTFGAGDAPDVENATVIDAKGLTLMPGMIDVHVHGSLGYETMDAKPEGVREMARHFAKHGVTSFLPTTWTESREKITETLEMVVAMQGPQPEGATIVGVHLEGPYIDAGKRGAQRLEHVRRAVPEEAIPFLDYNIIRLVALAPEYEENWWLIDECRRRGVTVSAAHTNATHDQMQHAIDLGVTQSTHTYNAMVGLHHREPGGAGAVLTRDEVFCELIADNIHVHPTMMKILYKTKGPDRVVLITDAVRAAGLPDGEYQKDEDRLTIVKDGIIRLPDGTLSGSSLTLDRGLRNFIAATGDPLEKVWRCSSLNAARAVGLSEHKGSLELGKDADIILVDDDINVYLTMAEGVVVHQQDFPQ